MANDPYQELGVPRSADADALRKSFRKLAKELHPDRNPGDPKAEERFKRVSAAFDILGDPEKKAKFDRGEIDADGRETVRGFDPRGPGGGFGRGPAGGFAGAGQGPQGGFGARFEGADLEDILGDIFTRGGPGPRPSGFGASKGADVRSRLEIDLEEAVRGGAKRVAFPDGRQLDVTIPKGAYDGQTLRLRGQGQPGRAGAGDALVELAVRPHPIYRRDGADLHMDLPVTLYDAVLGAKVQASTPEGDVTLTVPRGSTSGAVLRLKGRGAVDGQTGRRGDLFAKLIVALPEDDPDLAALAETLRRDRPYTPRRR